MSISGRIHDTIEGWQAEWKDRLKGWLATAFGFGLEIGMDIIGKAAAPKLKPLIDLIEATGKVPLELQPLLDEIKEPTGEVSAMLSQSAGGALVGGAVGKILDGVLLPIAYAVNTATKNVVLAPDQYITLWLRGFITDDKLKEMLNWQGLDDTELANIKELSQIRLTPEAIARLWMRDKPRFEKYWKDLKDIGASPDRIEALKELTYAMPTPQDLITWMAKEAFEPDAIEKYGLDAEYEKLDLEWFEKVGVKPDVIPYYWRSHWVHPAFREMTDMLHRGEITDADLYDWYRLVEIPPHWRDKLTSISWDLPNRIELRMMARYGLVDKAFLVEQLKMVGLREDFRSIAADMMLAMGIRTDLSSRYSKGWLDADGVKSELDASGLSPEVSERMYKWIVRNVTEDRFAPERDLTKSEIYKAIKKGALNASQGVELIRDMGYDQNEAEMLVSINVGALEGSPDTYQELKALTQMFKRIKGQPYRIPPKELIQAEKEVIAAERILKDVQSGDNTDMTEGEARSALESLKVAYHARLGQFKEGS